MNSLKDQLFSTIRVGVVAVIGAALSALIRMGLPGEVLGPAMQSLVEPVAFVTGTAAWYAIARITERWLPWLLLLPNPTASPPRNHRNLW